MRPALILLALVLFVYTGVGALMFALQSKLMYSPQRPMIGSPADAGLPFDSVTFAAVDGVQLSGWWIPVDDPLATVLFCHGNGGNISHLVERIRLFHDLRLSAFVFDYRGYGQSGGTPTEQGTYRDAEAAWEYVTSARGVDPRQLVVYGLSMGGPIAAHLAANRSLAKLVLEGTFTSIPDIGAQMYPLFPARRLARFDYNTLRYLSDVECPVLVVHSVDDEIVPFSHGQRLYDSIAGSKRLLKTVGPHADVPAPEPAYQQVMIRFIAGHDSTDTEPGRLTP